MQTKIFLLILTFLVTSFTGQAQKTNSVATTAERLNFTKPEEVRTFPLGKVDLIKIGGAMIGKAVFQPGWKWSESVKPMAKTNSCEAPHFQYHISGILRIKMDDGTTFDCKPGDVSYLPMGHDAWVIGKEPVVVIDFQGMIDYATANPVGSKQ